MMLRAPLSRVHPFLTMICAFLLLLSGSAPALPQQAGSWDEDGGYTADYSRIPRLKWMGPGAPGTYQAYLQNREQTPFQVKHAFSVSPKRGGARAPKALVLVNSQLHPGIQTNLDTYGGDLAAEGYQVEVYLISGGTPEDLKSFILGHASSLAGCALVGDLPSAWYAHEFWGYEQFPCDLYFMDLDGSWTDGNGDGLYDQHTPGSGDEGPEIFIGRLDTSAMSGSESDITNRYLEKNHAYRQGAFPVSHYALSYTDDDWAYYLDIRTDIKHAYPLFDDIPGPNTHRDDYLYNHIPSPAYEFVQLCCHSSSATHYFARGGLAHNVEMKVIEPRAAFYNLFCCSTLRFTEKDYLGGAYLYNDSETSVGVIGSTKTGSMLVFHAFYEPLGQGETFGEAFRQWFNYLAPYSEEERAWHYGMTIAGDPFLQIRETPLYLGFPDGLPEDYQRPGLETRLVIEIKDGKEKYVAGSGTFHYRFDPADPYSTQALVPLGNDCYEAVLPETRPGYSPQLYFTAQGDGGSLRCRPHHAPQDVYAFDVGFTETQWTDHFQTDRGWSVKNTGVNSGAWERANPGLTGAQPGKDYGKGGALCYVTGQQGGPLGTDNVGGGPTRLLSPPIDLSEGDGELRFFLWFYHCDAGQQQPLEIQVSNNGGVSWVKALEVNHGPPWKRFRIKVSDCVTPSSDVRLRFSASDNPNDSVVEALVDDFEVVRVDENPVLWADAYSLPVSTGGVIQFTMSAGPANGGRPYLLLGSASGTAPGVPLPGDAVLPLKWDFLTTLIMGSLGSPIFLNFTGHLDPFGEATATLDTFGPVNPNAAGAVLHFAYLLSPNPFFASNAMMVELEP